MAAPPAASAAVEPPVFGALLEGDGLGVGLGRPGWAACPGDRPTCTQVTPAVDVFREL